MARVTPAYSAPHPPEPVGYTVELSVDEAADLLRVLRADGYVQLCVARRENRRVYEIEAALVKAGVS